MSFRRAGTALLTTAALTLLGGCWGHVSDVDLVADAAVSEPVLTPGVYCPVQIWNDFTELDYADCDRIGWDRREGRHYYSDARIRWDELEQRPKPAAALDGFGAASVWLDAADLGRGLTLVQRAAGDGGDFDQDVVPPGRFVAFVIAASEGGFAVLPTAEGPILRALADDRGVALEPYEMEEARGLRIASGESAAARALTGDAATAWMAARRDAANDFRQLPAERSEIGPLYYVRLEALDPALPATVAVESAMFEMEQRLRSIAATL